MRHIGAFGSVTVFGGANLDHIATATETPVPGASNPGRVRVVPGGVGFNLALVLARLGHKVRLVSRVGADEAGKTIIAAAAAGGIDTATVSVSRDMPTATYQATLDDTGALLIGIADMAICDEITPAAVAEAEASAPPGDLWVVDANLPAETLDFLVGEAEAADRPIVALPVSPAKAVRLTPLLDRVGLIFANRKETAALLERNGTDKELATAVLADELCHRLAANAVITDADGPLIVVCEGKVRGFMPLRASVKSVNGAGDALAAGTLHGLAEGRPLFEAVMFGLAAAAITIESDGTLPAALTAEMVANRLVTGVGHTHNAGDAA